jgi:PAS domain S-box-containing protein
MSGDRSQLSAETLSRIMLLQGMMGQLPDESRICGFVCHGLQDVPGVGKVRYESNPTAATATRNELVFTVEISRRCYGSFIATLAEPGLFAPYEAYVRNLCFMVAVVLEERRQRAANVAYQKELELRVEERTRQLVEEKENLAVTLRSIGDAVITTDIQGNVVLMNAVAERLTGSTQSEAAGQPLSACFRIIHQHTRAPCANPVDKVLASNRMVELENHTVLVAKDGREYAIADSGAPIRAGDGSVCGVVLVFRDMTEKYRMVEMAQRADRLESLGVLAGGIAHDFNNLLGGIFGYLELAQLEATEPAVRQDLAAAAVTIERARGLTRQLLTFAKGGAPVKRGGTLLPVIKENARFALSGTNVSCQLDLPDDLWNCIFDPAQVSQVIDNLVINAVQAMPTGGSIEIVARNVSLAEGDIPTLAAGPFVKICIRDTGSGIPPALLQRIFDPFFTTKQTGNGLGLATAYSIVRRHDGTILVDSQPQGGTTFTLYFPAAPALAVAPATREAPSQLGRGSILVMDDERALLDVTSKFLSSLGYKVLRNRSKITLEGGWAKFWLLPSISAL